MRPVARAEVGDASAQWSAAALGGAGGGAGAPLKLIECGVHWRDVPSADLQRLELRAEETRDGDAALAAERELAPAAVDAHRARRERDARAVGVHLAARL